MAGSNPAEEGLIVERPSASDVPGPVLLATKLHVPLARPEHVARGRLLERLLAGAGRGLTLIDAPAGWGKTTLLAQWLAAEAESRRTAWVSLDEGDNDPVRFISYLVAALRTVEPDIGSSALAALRAPGTSLVGVVLPLLVNELDALSEGILLALDDYQLVENAEIHEAVAFLVGHLPPTLGLALGTRHDPPFRLASLRARGELTEIRVNGLGFTNDEATAFLNDSLSLDLAQGEIARLLERTEGWAAGLYLAALSLQSMGGAQESTESFSGDDRHLVDYFITEVLDREREELRSFLLRTSILERLSAPLCAAVTENSNSGQLLEELERSNLFLVPLDSKREWYRYHHLFGELLARQREDEEPHVIPTLHRRASVWHRRNGFVSEAIRHAIKGDDFAAAGDLIAGHWLPFSNDGRFATVKSWLDALPDEALLADPRLCIAGAWIALSVGTLDEAGRLLASAEGGTLSGPLLDGSKSLEAALAQCRAVHQLLLGDIKEAIAAARRADSLEDGPSGSGLVCTILGRNLYWGGEPQKARSVLEAGVRLSDASGQHISHAIALSYLAALHSDEGQALEAHGFAMVALELVRVQHLSEFYATAMAYIVIARSLHSRGERSRSEAEAERALDLAGRFGAPTEIAEALITLARVRASRGAPDEARARLREARRLLSTCLDPGIAAARLTLAETELRPVERDRAELTDRPIAELTDRELQVLRLLTTELSLREIASELYISLNTVKTHTKAIYRKLMTSSRARAVALAREHGVL